MQVLYKHPYDQNRQRKQKQARTQRKAKMTTTNTVYIPRMSKYITEEQIMTEFDNSWFGAVVRVDFVPIGKKPGFTEENLDFAFKSAFVHFHYYITQHHEFNTYFDAGKPYKHAAKCANEYWIILPNKNPIKPTMMNNAQIVENCRYLEGKVEQQQAFIESLEEKMEWIERKADNYRYLEYEVEEQQNTIGTLKSTITALENKLDGVHQVVYQLLGGLFNNETQEGILNTHLSIMFPKNASIQKDASKSDISKWELSPTTHQGDYCEARIKALEARLNEMTTFDPIKIFSNKVEYDEETIVSSSTHSSMPDLIEGNIIEEDEDEDVGYYEDDQDEDEETSSMPSLEEVNSTDSSLERIRNSYDLCGNA